MIRELPASPVGFMIEGSMSTETFRLRYLAKSVAGVPRDLIQTAVAQVRAIKPTVFIYNCTWV